MNKFKNIKIRRKLVISFLFISLISSLIAYLGSRNALQNITDEAIPIIQTIDQTSQLISDVQRESMEYFSGDDEPDQLETNIKALANMLNTLPSLSNESEGVTIFNNLADIASENSDLSLRLVASHNNTNEKIETLSTNISNNEQVFFQINERVNEELAESIESGALDELFEDALPTLTIINRLKDDIQLMELSIQNFLLTGEDDALRTFEAAQQSAEEYLVQLEATLEEDEANEGDLLTDLTVLVQETSLLGQEALDSHQNTLSLLEELEDQEGQLESIKASAIEYADREVNESLVSVQRNILITGTVTLFLTFILALAISQTIASPIVKLTAVSEKIIQGDLTAQANIESTDEIGTLAQAFNSMTRQLSGLVDDLDQRVSARTRDLNLANQIGRNVSEIRDSSQLLSYAVKLVHDEFDLYLAQIYLVEEDQETLLLHAAEGQAANRLLAQGHYLAITTASINGTAVSQKRAVVVPDTTEDPFFRPNPLLPDTRSEMAVPLLVADKVIGVLDIQSTVPNTFTEENMPAFIAMAGSLAIALENASLFNEREAATTAMETILAETEQQAHRLTGLNEMGANLAAASKLDDVYQIIGSRILTLIEGDRASLALITETGDSAEVFALQGEKGAIPTGTTLPFTGTAVGLAIQENSIVQLPKDSPLSTYADSRQLAQKGLRSLVLLPLNTSGHVIGTLNIGSTQSYAFSESDINFAQQIAALLASTIDRLNLVERVQSLATLVENHPDFIGIGTLAGEALYINPAGLALLGLPADFDITSMGATDFYIQEDAERLQQEGIPAALETGSWTAEVQLQKANGTTIPVEQTIAINYDTEGKATNFSITMRDMTNRKQAAESQNRLRTQLEERLLQVNAMQRAMTHEGWSAFLTSSNRLVQGFKFNEEQIGLISTQDVAQGKVPSIITQTDSNDAQLPDPSTTAVPVDVRGQTIGIIGAKNTDGTPLSTEQSNLLNAMSQQVATALDRARLFEEMELAREQMNALYSGSERVIRATSIDEVLIALVESTKLRIMDTANFLFFSEPWDETAPDTMTVGAIWEKVNGFTPEQVDDVYKIDQFPSMYNVNKDEPTLFYDVATDERAGPDAKMLAEQLNVKCVLYFPLIVGNQWFGLLSAKATNSIKLAGDEIKQITGLVDQAATVSQTQRLFTQAQSRARREQLLREVGAKVYAAPDAETIMKTAVKEVNRIMGVDSFVYLDAQSPKQEKSTNGTPLATEETASQEG